MKTTIVRQWTAGLAFVVLVIIALVRLNSNIELRYEPGTNDAGPVLVQCLSDQQPRLRTAGFEVRHHRVLQGDDVLRERAMTDAERGGPGDLFNVPRGVDDDCLRAQLGRTQEVGWWLFGAVLCAIGYAMARLRLPMLQRDPGSGGRDVEGPRQMDADSERYRTRR